MKFALICRSGFLSRRPEVLDRMARLSNSQQYYHFAPDWGLSPSIITIYQDERKAPSVLSVPRIYIEDEPDEPGAGGYHDEAPGGLPAIKVFVSPYLDNGGTLMESPDSVLVALTHEMCETVVDAEASDWVDMPDGARLVAREVSDPVQDRAYILRLVAGGPVGFVTDYVTPRWFERLASSGRFDRMGALRAPFTRTNGGYWIVRDSGGEPSAEFGWAVPEWKRSLKLRTRSRTGRRISPKAGACRA